MDTAIAHQKMNFAWVVALEFTTVPFAAGHPILALGRTPRGRGRQVEQQLDPGKKKVGAYPDASVHQRGKVAVLNRMFDRPSVTSLNLRYNGECSNIPDAPSFLDFLNCPIPNGLIL